MPIGNYETQGIEPLLGRAEPCGADASRLGNLDFTHGAGLLGQMRPHAERLENTPAAIAQGGGTIVETRLSGRIGGDGLDQRDALAGAAERQCQTCADQAPAYDRHIDDGGHPGTHAAAISFSIASGSVGAPAVSTSWPLAVTATSSSMRTPIFQKRFGTPLVPAGM